MNLYLIIVAYFRAALTAVEGMEEQMHIDRNKKVSSDKRILVIAGAGGVGSCKQNLSLS